jgi:hypothetical protein
LTSPAGACDKVAVHLQHAQKFTWCFSKVRGNPRPMTGSSSDSTDRTAACASDGISSASSADTPRSCKQAWVMVLSSAGVECANVSLTASRVVPVTVSFVATLRPPNLPLCEASNGNETHDHTPAVGSKRPFTPYSCPSASIYPLHTPRPQPLLLLPPGS